MVLFNAENRIGADLEVVAMRDYARGSSSDDVANGANFGKGGNAGLPNAAGVFGSFGGNAGNSNAGVVTAGGTGDSKNGTGGSGGNTSAGGGGGGAGGGNAGAAGSGFYGGMGGTGDDGFNDGDEAEYGTDPNDSKNYPVGYYAGGCGCTTAPDQESGLPLAGLALSVLLISRRRKES